MSLQLGPLEFILAKRASPISVLANLSIILLTLVASGCGASRTLKPLGEGRSQAHLSLGGPLVTVGVPIPAPYSVIGYDYGFNDEVNLHGSWHPTAAAYKVFASELGASFGLLNEQKWAPEVLLDSRVAVASNGESTVAYPIFTPIISYTWINLSWYLGSDFLFQLHENDRIYTPQAISPFIGTRMNANMRLKLGLELKWTAINHDLTYNNVDHPDAFGTQHGNLAPFIFVGYDFE